MDSELSITKSECCLPMQATAEQRKNVEGLRDRSENTFVRNEQKIITYSPNH